MKCYLFIILIGLVNCKNNNTSNLEIEKNVFDQIFIKVVNSTYKDKRLYLAFPNDETKNKDSLEKDTIDLVIAIDKKIGYIMEEDRQKIPKTFKPISDSLWEVNLSKFKSKKFIFKNLSELPNKGNDENWSLKYEKFVGSLHFSKLYFDEEKNNGILAVTYSCGKGCEIGYLVYIKKDVNNKWIINNVKQTWIS